MNLPDRTLGVAVALVLGGVAPGEPHVAGFEFAPDKARLLAGELNCTKCHASDDIDPKGAPSLAGVGARLQADWLREFLTDPAKAHPGTTMPDVLVRSDDREAKVDELVHYLASMRDWQRPRLAKHASASTGEQLFSRIGCAACHEAEALSHVEAKYSFPALVDFLRRPLHYRPGGRMPDLKLTAGEAADLGAFLSGTAHLAENTQRAPLRPFAVDRAKATRGAALFRSVGCANCHPLDGSKPELAASPFGRGGGCRIADYGLSDTQLAALAKPLEPTGAERQLAQGLASLNCYACHPRDGMGGVSAAGRESVFTGDDTLGNEGRFPPHLNRVGAKLTEETIVGVLAGESVLRPYLHTRMPVFGEANVGHLPALFAEIDRPDGEGVVLKGGKHEAGRVLLGTQGGVGCISCHGVGGRKGLAMGSVSLAGAARRYRPGWFREHLIDPQATSPGTLMPSFWPGGVAGNKAVLDGDTERQIASIWSYLEHGGELPPGFPSHDKGEFEIVPEGRPTVQRTMMPGAGTHAIAVGFPEGTHFVYDALNCRLAGVWRGRFLDGYKPWFSRKDPTAEPLGVEVMMLPDVPRHPHRHFMGYELDPGGIPEFLYRDAGDEVRVRIVPAGNGLRKTTTRGDRPPVENMIQWR